MVKGGTVPLNRRERIWKVGVYIRLSVADGNDESLSVSNQREILNTFLKRNFEDLYEITDYYIDDGISGTTEDVRESFQRMVYDITKRRVDCVICKNLERIFRNYAAQGYYLEEFFPLHGVRFIALESPMIDTLKQPDIVQGYEIPIKGIFNDRFAQKTSMEVRRTFKKMGEQGQFLGGFAPYGYIRNPEDKYHFLIDEAAADVVRLIFHLYVAEGCSLAEITRRLNDKGIPNPTRHKRMNGMNYRNPYSDKSSTNLWSTTTVKHILQNQTYLGRMVTGKTAMVSYKVHKAVPVQRENWNVKENMHEKIIDQDIFDKAQKRLGSRQRAVSKTGKVHLLSGLIRCADCGASMQRRHSSKIIYFGCSTYYRASKKECTNHLIREDKVHGILLKIIQAHIQEFCNIPEVLQGIEIHRRLEKVRQKKEDERKRLKAELERLANLEDEIYADWKQGVISKEQFLRLKRKSEGDAERLEKQIWDMEKEIEATRRGGEKESKLCETFQKYQNIQKLDRELVQDLIERVEIHHDKSITIYFKFQDETDAVKSSQISVDLQNQQTM